MLTPAPDGQLELDGLGVCQVRFGSLQKPPLQRLAIAREPRMQPVLEHGIDFPGRCVRSCSAFSAQHNTCDITRVGSKRRTRVWRCCMNRHWPARCQPTGFLPADAIRRWSAGGGHPIQDLTAEDDLTPLPGWAPGAKTIADDGLVAEERVLHPALTMVPDGIDAPICQDTRLGGWVTCWRVRKSVMTRW